MARGRPFAKGASGNPAGKPKGARHRTTLAAEALLEGEAEALTRKAIELAKDGDGPALRLCLDRIIPPRKDRPTPFKLRQIEDAAQATAAMADVVRAVSLGALTPSEAGEVSKVIETFVRTLEANDFERRLQALEGRGHVLLKEPMR
jgi:hypothetical protein